MRTLAVARSDGTVVWAGAAGWAQHGQRSMTADTPICLSSVTKLYTATVDQVESSWKAFVLMGRALRAVAAAQAP